jgi:hypothetical protein
MNIGDKVRNIRGTEEGIVTRLLKDNLVEVEIEDGFAIPFLKSELVIVSSSESKYFKKNEPSAAEVAKTVIPRSEKGIYLALVPISESTYTVSVINNTDWEMPYTLHVGEGKGIRGMLSGSLSPKSSQQASSTLKMQDFDEWSTLSIQALYYQAGYAKPPNALLRKLRLKANLFKEKRYIPLTDRKGYVVQLDAEESVKKESDLDATKLQEKFNSGVTSVSEPVRQTFKPGASVTVDLHIEKLTTQFLSMNNAEMITLQISHFEKQLEKSIATGADEITFIHGVGSGKLRQEVHRRLSQHPNVAWYKDAQKEKFGFGATLANLK